MKDWESFIEGKKVTIMGLGLLGRGVGDVAFLARHGAELIVTDKKTTEELASSVTALSEFKNITYVLGEHRLEDFRDRDFILKAAGVPLDSPYIAEARKAGIPIEMSTALFAAVTPATVVGVTGTRGKSTVTEMLHVILTEAFEGTKKIFLGGNIRGVATLPFLEEAGPNDIAVLELDSWQLQGFGERHVSPQVAVFTTFLPDHLNYYGGDMKRYFADKANIFMYQKPSDVLVASPGVDAYIHQYAASVPGTYIVADASDFPRDWKLQIPGEHNRLNAALAAAAAARMGVPDEIIQRSLDQFRGVPGRLEKIREYNGISIYNDTNATTPDATLAGLRALNSKNTVLIMGGADKNLDMSNLIAALPEYTKAVVLLAGSGSNRIEKDLAGYPGRLEKAATLAEAVAQALALAESGDILLLSPAFASFGLFKNEYDRGDQFVSIINQLS